MPTPAIQVEHLSKNYGPVLAVNNVSFQVQPGELVGFLGPNGAGKSTTMRVLTTYLPASSGYAYVAGYDVMYQSMQVRERIGYLPESVPLYPEMRVSEYLGYRARLKSVPRTGRVARLDDLMTRCRIKEVKNRLLGTLSKGYRQRVGLADAMLNEPPVLILDEPTSGLDPIQIAQTLETIKALGGRHTVLLSTHILSEVEKICERVIIINKGQVKFDDTLKSIAEREPTLQLEVRGPAAEVEQFLRNLPEVSAVTTGASDDGVPAFEVKLKNRQELRETLAARITAKGWGLRRLDLKRASLEDQYMQVVLRQDAAAEPVAPPAPATEPEPTPATEPPAPPAA